MQSAATHVRYPMQEFDTSDLFEKTDSAVKIHTGWYLSNNNTNHIFALLQFSSRTISPHKNSQCWLHAAPFFRESLKKKN